jgi:hypothetical protein
MSLYDALPHTTPTSIVVVTGEETMMVPLVVDIVVETGMDMPGAETSSSTMVVGSRSREDLATTETMIGTEIDRSRACKIWSEIS